MHPSGWDSLDAYIPLATDKVPVDPENTISHPIGQDPMILCINAQAASSGDLAQGFG